MFKTSTVLADRRAPRQVRSSVIPTAAAILITLAVIPPFLPSGAAHAAAVRPDRFGAYSIRVGYSDLDLRRPEGRKALGRRVSWAAHEACRLAGPPTPLDDPARLACVRRALSGARPQVRAALAAARQDG